MWVGISTNEGIWQDKEKVNKCIEVPVDNLSLQRIHSWTVVLFQFMEIYALKRRIDGGNGGVGWRFNYWEE